MFLCWLHAEHKEPVLKGDSDLSYVKGNGKLVIGYTDYAPMNYTDESGTFTGFDTELAILTCKTRSGTPIRRNKLGYQEVELNAKSIDCIWNGLTINDGVRQLWK